MLISTKLLISLFAWLLKLVYGIEAMAFRAFGDL
jgi:hypothetical protein